MTNSKKISKVIKILICLLVVIYPLLPLLRYDNFYVDWFNHLWPIEYMGKYFKENFSFPHVFNTDNSWMGMATPIYYGVWFYRIAGLLSIILGGKNAIVVCAFICFLLQMLIWKKLFDLILKKESLLSYIAVFPIWGAYSLSNLYNRSALTEFFAVSMLFIAIGLWLLLFFIQERYKTFTLICFSGSIFFIAGTHPITTLYSGLVFLIIMIFTLPILFRRKEYKLIRTGCICLLLVLCSALPWIYAVVKVKTRIGQFPKDYVFYNGIDGLRNRISLIPVDFRYVGNVEEKIEGGGTPYLTAPINMALFLFYIVTLIVAIYCIKNFKAKYKTLKIAALVLPLFVGSLVIYSSVTPEMGFPDLLYLAQFAYRLVSYIDIIFLIGVVINFITISKEKISDRIYKILAVTFIICISFSFQSVLVKFIQVKAIADQLPYNIENTISLPASFYGTNDFISTDEFNQDETVYDSIENKQLVPLEVSSGRDFGRIKTNEIMISQPTLIGLRMYPHPWNSVTVNGEIRTKENTYYFPQKDGDHVYILLKESGTYKIGISFTPDIMFIRLQKIAYISVILLIFLFLITLYNIIFKKNTVQKSI